MPESPTPERRALVIGAGIVGVSCALALQKRGFRVTVVDRLEPGEGASYGNAGVIAVSSCVPLIMPGSIRKAPGWLLRRDGPLAIDWRYLPTMAGWLARALRSATPSEVLRIGKALRALHGPAVEDHFAQAEGAGCAELLRRARYMFVYETEAGYEADRKAWELRASLGIPFEPIDARRIRELAPALAPIFVRGVLMEDHAVARDPAKLVKALADDFQRRQGRVLRAEVRGLSARNGTVEIATSEGSLEAEHVVIAAGAWSAELARPLGYRFPLVAERGYHVTFEDPGIEVEPAVMFAEAKFVANSMEGGLRLAGTAEFAPIDKPASAMRGAVIERAAKRLLPGLDVGRPRHWMGPRPSLPDSLPVIGRAARHAGLYFAFGHGHTGLTAAPTTARIVAALVAGEAPPIDIAPFSLERFGGQASGRAASI